MPSIIDIVADLLCTAGEPTAKHFEKAKLKVAKWNKHRTDNGLEPWL